jgi:hypothetical protein
VVAAALVALLFWIRAGSETEPMVGPGRFRDATGMFQFDIPQGWRAIYQGSQTRVEPVGGKLPAYTLDARTVEQISFVVNWNCQMLPAHADQMTRAIMPWPVTPPYIAVPCAQSEGVAAYVQAYATLDDGSGRSAMAVFGPLDGQNWVVAVTDPFQGEASRELVDTMTASVTTSRR